MDFDALIRFVDRYVDADFSAPPYDPTVGAVMLPNAGRSQAFHERVLQHRNGFYAFNGLLHVMGACTAPPNHSLLSWNDPTGWRGAWGATVDGLTFFAQSAFGDQFGYRGGKIVRLRALEGIVVASHASLDEWFEAALLDPESTLSQRAFDACVRVHGPLPHGGHFAPVGAFNPDLPIDPAAMTVVPTRDSMEMKAAAAVNVVRRRSSMSVRVTR
jgi:hypothetical protein